MVSGKNNLFGFMPASLLLLKLLASIFPSIRTGLSCLRRNLPKTIAHWQNSFQSILSQTSTLENFFLKNSPFHTHCEFAS